MDGIRVLMFWFAGVRTWNEGRTFQQVAEFLAGRPEVAQVTVTFPPTINRDCWRRPYEERRLGGKLSLLTETRGVVPERGAGFGVRRGVNRLFSQHLLPTLLRRRGFRRDNTVLWMFPPHPHVDRLVASVPARLLVAQVIDNFAMHGDPWLNRYAQEQYPRLQRDADLIFVGSRFNAEYFARPRGGVHLMENAVDADFLGVADAPPCRRGSTPRIGYVGTLNERTDLALLRAVAEQRPQWKIVIAGKSEYPLEEVALLRCPNVEHVGVLPYAALPAFLQTLDVCVIPHRDTAYSKSMSPLKLFQYLASGRPVVSTAIAGIDTFSDLLRVARDEAEFIAAIDDALENDTAEHSARRIERASQETWEPRLRGMFDIFSTRWRDGERADA
jgi:glycosyltransferase involved in cell wall biosynthesis